MGTQLPAIQSYGIRDLYTNPSTGAYNPNAHLLGAPPQEAARTFQSIYDRTSKGSMMAVPYAMEAMYSSGIRNPMTTAFHTYLNSDRGSPAYLNALQAVSTNWNPFQYMNAIKQQGLGHFFRPENFAYISNRAAADPRMQDWRTYGSSKYMMNELGRRGAKPLTFSAGLPAFEWANYNRAAQAGLQRLYSNYMRQGLVSELPQDRSPVVMLLNWLRGSGGDLKTLLAQTLKNITETK